MEGFYYNQNDNNSTVFLIDNYSKTVKIIKRVPADSLDSQNAILLISEQTANVILSGFINNYYSVYEETFMSRPSDDDLRKFKYESLIMEKYNDKKYKWYIDEELKLVDDFTKKMLDYYALNDKHIDSIKKISSNKHTKWDNYLKSINVDDCKSDLERQLLLATKRNTKEFIEAYSEIKNDPDYIESDNLCKQMTSAFGKFVESMLKIDAHFKKERNDLVSKDYEEKLDEYADKGLFLYCLNTPDLPLLNDEFTIEDTYKHFLNNNCMYFFSLFKNFISLKGMGQIFEKEANDIIASLFLLNQGNYMAALRNIFSLIEHHHKLCANILNGYYETEKRYKNGKLRSNRIGEIIDSYKSQYFIKIWNKIDKALNDINKDITKIYPPRNKIVHGDYEDSTVNPSSYDVVNLLMIYLNMRTIVDYFKNIEEVIRLMDTYSLGYLINIEKK